MSEENAAALRKIRAVFAQTRRKQIDEAVRMIAAGNPAGAMLDARNAIILQADAEKTVPFWGPPIMGQSKVCHSPMQMGQPGIR